MPKVWSKNERCLWCKKTDSPPATEDVFGKWIIREYGAQTSIIYRTDATTGIRHKARGNAGILSPLVCRNCNTRWMSQLENNVKPLFAEMMRGVAIALDDSDRLNIAKWMLKTSIMYEHAKQGTYFSAVDRTNVLNGLFPTYAMIFAARYIAEAKLVGATAPWNIQAQTTSVRTRHQNQFGTFDGQAKCITFIIEQLTLQLFTVRDNPKFKRGGVQFQMAPRWNDEVLVPIYPLSGRVNWPPRFALDDAGLIEFIRRWDNTSKT